MKVTNLGEAGIIRGEVLVYETPDGGMWVEVKLDRETVWLTQR